MKFAERTNAMRASEIREILKVTENEEIISFAGGLPSPQSFPVKAIAQLTKKVLREHGPNALQYGTTEGLNSLREAIVQRMEKRFGITCDRDNILITAGSQEALDLIGKIFLDSGDFVAVELPTYLGALTAFNVYQPRYLPVKMDRQGMVVDDLDRKLAEQDNVKFIYTSPTFQNPTGLTMSLERRKQLLSVAEKYRIPVVEDNAYAELRYSGEEVPLIKSMDKDGLVIYLGTFSKVLSPGFRLGWVIGSKGIIRKLVLAKQGTDLCTNVFVQFIANEYLRSGLIDKQISKIKHMYKRKRDIMLKALKKHFPEGGKWTKPDGGMFLWIELPKSFGEIPAQDIFEEMMREKVAFVPGAAFLVERSHKSFIRLNFSNADDKRIEEGIKRLSEIVKKRMMRQ